VVGPGRAGLSHPTLSPDGRRIAFGAGPLNNGDIWVHDLGRGTETRLTFGAEDDWAPTWLSPTRVAYIQMAGLSSGVSGRILAVNADGSGEQQVIAPEAPLGAAPSALAMAPGGRTALQIVDERGHGRLRVAEIQPDGRLGPLQRILRIEPEPDVSEAGVSPDGRLLAYVTDNPGLPELFLTRFPSGEGRWQVTTDAARNPHWVRETGELLFSTGLREDTLFSVKVDPAQDPPLGSPSELFRLDTADRPGSSYRYGWTDFDVTADGRRLLVVRPGAGATARRMVLVQNWLAEFRKPGGR
jgi:eukaryotic-like serine/threonine-protein kinase